MKSSFVADTQQISPWNYKPWWCQPWSILLTGISIMGGSWILFHTIWLTVAIALPICTWMGFFLLIWPRLIRAEYYSKSAEDS